MEAVKIALLKTFVFVSTNGSVKEGGCYVVKEVVLVKEAVKEVVDRARTTYMCLVSPLSSAVCHSPLTLDNCQPLGIVIDISDN